MDKTPSAKTGVAVGGVAAGGTLIVWLLGLWGIPVTPEVAIAIATVITGVVNYFVPAKSGKHIDTDAQARERDLLTDTGGVSGDEFALDDPPQDGSLELGVDETEEGDARG